MGLWHFQRLWGVLLGFNTNYIFSPGYTKSIAHNEINLTSLAVLVGH